jgi:hypothetical protein
MHAVVIDVTIHDLAIAEGALNEQVVPAAKQAPGFVAGYWLRPSDDKGKSVVVFESEQAARAWAESPPADMPDPAPVTIDNMDTVRVVASG